MQAIVKARELDLIVKQSHTVSYANTNHLPEPSNPYKGLNSFQVGDAHDFFGREKLVEKLIDRLQETNEYNRFLAVVGPSGSGKSSVVQAGLIPALWRGELPGSDKWYVTHFIPGQHPIDKLEVKLLHVADNKNLNLGEQLARDANGLVRAADLILPDHQGDLLIIIDQFEEIFTLVENEADRIHFLDLIYTAVTDIRSRVRILVTLRADYYDRPLLYPQLGELMRHRVETVLPLSAEELEQAISKPAAQQGILFEDGLVSHIVADVNYQPGTLPLLQYALTELFERRNERTLTVEKYNEIGGTGGALAMRADELFLECDGIAREQIRQLFLRLVTLGEGAEDTRRRVLRSELLDIANDNADIMDEIIDEYAASRLLSLDNETTTREPTVEVAHEAILREWERLRKWLNDNRYEIRLQRQLASMANEWHNAEEEISYLASGSRLEQFESWAAKTELALTQDETTYLDASIAGLRLQKQVEHDRSKREANLERRSTNRLRMLVGVFAISTVIAIGLTMFAFDRESRAQNNFIRAERIRLGAQAQITLDQGEDVVIPALLSLQSLRLGYSPEADGTLLGALSHGFLRQVYSGHTEPMAGVAFSPDGNYVLTANADATARLWDAKTGESIHQFQGHSALVHDAIFSPNGQQVITVSNDSTARIWNVESGEELQRISDHDGPVWGLDISPNGAYIVTSDESGAAYLWDTETGQKVREFVGHDDTINGISFSSDGRFIVTGSWDTTARLWDVESGDEIRRFEGHTDCVCGVAFSPDGRQILTGSYDQTAILWKVETGEILRLLEGHTDVVILVRFSPDGRLALTGSLDRTTRLWNLENGDELRRVDGTGQGIAFSPDGQYVVSGNPTGDAWLWEVEVDLEPRSFRFEGGVHEPTPILAVISDDQTQITIGMRAGAVVTYDVETMQQLNMNHIPTESLLNVMLASPNGELIATGGSDGITRLFDAQTAGELRQFVGHQGAIRDIGFSSDNFMIVTVGDDAMVRLWDAASGDLLHKLTGHNSPIRAVAFSADDRTVVTAGDDAIIHFWDVESGKLLNKLETDHIRAILDIAISLDGSYMLTASADNSAQLWDIESGQAIRQLVGHTEPVRVVAFSQDGDFMVTGSDDLTARIWGMKTGETVRHFSNHDTPLRMVMFTHNGQYLFVGSINRGYLWRTDLAEVIALTCSQLPRDFTEAERIIYSLNNSISSCEALD